MTEGGHSFGPTCAYYEGEPNVPLTTDSSTPSKVKAQFFYVSSLPIDDPLSPLPPIQADKSLNVPPQPFSVRDNAALEEAWQEFQQGVGGTRTKARPASRGLHRMFSFPKFRRGFHSPELTSPVAESSSQKMLGDKGGRKGLMTTFNNSSTPDLPSTEISTKTSAPKPSRRASTRSNRSRTHSLARSTTQTMLGQSSDQPQDSTPVDARELKASELTRGLSGRGYMSPSIHRHSRDVSPISERSLPQADLASSAPFQLAADSDMSGKPFARAPSTRQILSSIATDNYIDSDTSPETKAAQRQPAVPSSLPSLQDSKPGTIFVPVGVSRLHLVEFPDLQMKPIYWSPINDTSAVIRATWFYKDTMLPVSADVANRLEIGYEDMKPFTPTYQDELNACVENGAAAEMKIVHKLWPGEKKASRPSTALDDKSDDQDVDAAAEDETIGPEAHENAAADLRKSKKKKLYESYSVIYINARDAQILRPNSLPSVSKKRTPLSAIRKGRHIGIAVVRGFDRKTWSKLHPDPKKDIKTAEAKVGAMMSQSNNAATRPSQPSCPKCDEEDEKPKVSDLVLVVHGIGQKLSERVDSFHFTHAINGLRREFNIELATESMRSTLRGKGGMMVLPVNWRLTLKFDEVPKSTESSAENKFELKDITPGSLPAVRSLISDVMLDIPYYMSHHKSKMIAAVIREANRVYRLWCKNNPGFQDYGRVHVVAHSLGSVMAMEILSDQPTMVPQKLDLINSPLSGSMFEFNTTNLFCCGSPSGFFLLLNGANLIPRKGRNKAGGQGEDNGRGVEGEAGRFGCLAVDNLYNIVHRNDPIAYQQNACVDRDYAASLQQASVPSATQSFFGRLGNSLRWAGSSNQDAYGLVGPAARPHVQQMPSTVELETHNFTQEEVAEKRMYLLNDNGQIDYFLNSGGGPLEIQYLNMLSAHSSYWILQDFVRFLVVEIGRRPGRENTLPILRAVKKREFKKGNLA